MMVVMLFDRSAKAITIADKFRRGDLHCFRQTAFAYAFTMPSLIG